MKRTLAQVQCSSRDEAIARFEGWLEGTTDQDIEQDRRKWILENVHSLKGKTLGCFCAPLSCHGDILARRADAS